MRYFAAVGPIRGPIVYGTTPDALGVLEASDRPMPVGVARYAGWDEHRRALWTLSVHGEDLPGRWVVVDREFQPADWG
jgi:hypothetical protein